MIQQGQCTVFKLNLLKGVENFNTGTIYTYKLALYTANANLGPDTTAYTSTGEVTGGGYTATGRTLVPTPPASSGTTAYVTFANVTWPAGAITARAGLIYNATTGAAVAVLDFGSDKTANPFTVTFPAATYTTAVLRLA